MPLTWDEKEARERELMAARQETAQRRYTSPLPSKEEREEIDRKLTELNGQSIELCNTPPFRVKVRDFQSYLGFYPRELLLELHEDGSVTWVAPS